MVKGWIRGQGEFNLVYKNKTAWSEIFGFFSNACEFRRITALCAPFCKVRRIHRQRLGSHEEEGGRGADHHAQVHQKREHRGTVPERRNPRRTPNRYSHTPNPLSSPQRHLRHLSQGNRNLARRHPRLLHSPCLPYRLSLILLHPPHSPAISPPV
jgi:hypothetical protein